jgi:hypothetical protein
VVAHRNGPNPSQRCHPWPELPNILPRSRTLIRGWKLRRTGEWPRRWLYACDWIALSVASWRRRRNSTHPDFCFFVWDAASVILKRGAPSQRPRAYCVASSLCPGLSIGATGGPRYSPELRGARYMIPSFVQQPSNVKCPHCPRCQGRMVLARIRASSICEKRSFDCPYCNFIETQIVDDPVRTAALVRLANSIRPPT